MLALKWQSQDWNPSLSEFKALVLLVYTLLLALIVKELICTAKENLDLIP